jgi:uncharacterized membrane protein YphA (DoxX/SURF4 family)
MAATSDRKDLCIAFLRIAIGWHFFYEGLAKLLHPGWTSAGYLKSSTGPLGTLFQWLASDNVRVAYIDQLNVWGLMLIGIALMLGLFIRPAAFSGMGLLALYYVAYPPLFAPTISGSSEGNYLIINKNLVEFFALATIAATRSLSFALDGLRAGKERVAAAMAVPLSRREAMASLVGVPVLGALALAVLKKHGWKSFEEVQLRAKVNGKDAYVASPTMKTFQFATLRDLKGTLPTAKVNNLTMSRMILGGNLIGGWAHARDLIYVSKLVKAYHHRDKIFETFAMAERCGVNTVLTNPLLCTVINDYWRNGGRIQFISDCGGKNTLEMIQKSIDNGASACYIQGGVADDLVEKGNFDIIAKSLDLTRRNGLPAGIGGHKLKTIQTCVEKGLLPDFWMKTLHQTNYWSASPRPECDNIWCEDPVSTATYMRERKEPWIAFKILAAGALKPQEQFKFAFEQGADFICVGMYDFQIVEDVNLALAVLKGGLTRQREWRA